MKRRRFNAVLVISLLLWLALGALWLRSIRTCDSVARGQLNDAGYSLATFPGGVEFTATAGLSGAWFGIWQPGWRRTSFDWGTPRFKFVMNGSAMVLGVGLAQWTPPARYLLGCGF